MQHLATLLPLLLLLGVWVAAARSASASAIPPVHSDEAQHPAQAIDWPDSYHSVPWLAPASKQFPWEGVTDLPRLAKIQTGDPGGEGGGASSAPMLTVMIYSKATSRWALNLVYSLVMHGRVSKSYMVAALDSEALRDCQTWRLPCLDAAWALDKAPADTPAGGSDGSTGSSSTTADAATTTTTSSQPVRFKSRKFNQLNWAKVRIVGRMLDLGYTAHFSDTDLIYLRDVYQSYNTLFQVYKMDGVFMRETPVNTGAFVLRPNNRTRAMVKAWLAAKVEADLSNQSEQDVMPALEASKAFRFCLLVEQCLSFSGENMTSIYQHTMQFLHTFCPHGPVRHQCHPDRLFLHAVCLSYTEKATFFRDEKLWLVDNHAQPMYSPVLHSAGASGASGRRQRHGAGHGQQGHMRHTRAEAAASGRMEGAAAAVQTSVTVDNRTLSAHPFLPCSAPAWSYMRARYGDMRELTHA